MRSRAALLTMAAALIMTIGLTGCGSRDNMSTKNVRQQKYGQDGIRPLGTDYRYNANRSNTHFQNDGLRNYSFNDFGPNSRGYHYDGYGTYYNNLGYNRMDGGGYYGAHSVGKMEMSQKIANKLTSIKGVKSANVLLTNNNAYVAVVTDYGTIGNGIKGGSNGYGNHPYYAGTNRGSYGGTPAMYDHVSVQIKEHIANVVKREAPNSYSVYVSANPNFVSRMNEYSKRVAAGHPLSGFTNEFQEMVYSIFPMNAAIHDNYPTRMHNRVPGPR